MLIKNRLLTYLQQNNDLSESKLSNLVLEHEYLNYLVSRQPNDRESIPLLNQYKQYAKQRIKYIKLQLAKRNQTERKLLQIFEQQTTTKGER